MDNLNKQDENDIQHLNHPLIFEVFDVVSIHNEYKITLLIKHNNHNISNYYITFTSINLNNYLSSLHNLNFAFIPLTLDSLFDNANKYKLKLQKLCTYLSTRYDILSSSISQLLFKLPTSICFPLNPQLLFSITTVNETLSSNPKLPSFTVSNIQYDTNTGLLLLSYEDLTFASTIGKFWNINDTDIMGSIVILQREYDGNFKPFFINKFTKNFDMRVSTIAYNNCDDVIYVGFENGITYTFIVDIHDMDNNDTSTQIKEGTKMKLFNERVISFEFLGCYVFVCGNESKIAVFTLNESNKNVLVNASIQKRIEGKGQLNLMYIFKDNMKLYICTNTDLILVYDILSNKMNNSQKEIELSFHILIETQGKVKGIGFNGLNEVIIAVNNGIQVDKEMVMFNGKEQNEWGEFINVCYPNGVKCFCWFEKLQLLIFGLVSGVLFVINRKGWVLQYAMQITKWAIVYMVVIEETNVLVVGDEKGNCFFIQLI
jgi:hypothetical protein